MPKSEQKCCVLGCANSPRIAEIEGKKTQFYTFPRASTYTPWRSNKRQKWINAVIKFNRRDPNWEPSSRTLICSDHFIGNEKSEHPNHPSYTPTIFPGVDRNSAGLSSLARFQRLQKRNTEKAVIIGKTVPLTEISEISSTAIAITAENSTQAEILQPSMISVECQTDYCEVDESFNYFMCNLSTDDHCAAVQVSLSVKKTKEVGSECDLPRTQKITHDFSCDPIKQDEIVCRGFHGMKSIINDAQLSSLTNVSFQVFNFLLNITADSIDTRNLSKKDKLLLFLMKLKLGISFSSVAILFNVHRTTAMRTFVSILQLLHIKLQNAVYWPSKEAIRENLPEVFRKKFPNTRAIIDCTEIKTEMPSTIQQKNYLFSHYKSSYTNKVLIACTPSGCISFISPAYGGRASDGFITNDCRFLDLIEPGDVILADKGFPSIRTDVENKNAMFVMPPFLHDLQFTAEEIQETYNIASVRIHIERCIQRVKEFGILAKISMELEPHMDAIMRVICALVNFQPPIIQEFNHESVNPQ